MPQGGFMTNAEKKRKMKAITKYVCQTKKFGWWKDKITSQEDRKYEGTRYLDPTIFIDNDWDQREKEMVAIYLDDGERFNLTKGHSFCRLCGITGRQMGDSDLTDGIWEWPEGLSHYVRVHNVKPPDCFLRHIFKNY